MLEPVWVLAVKTHIGTSSVMACILAWTKKNNLGVDGPLMLTNDVSIAREYFAKISEFLKRNWLRAAPFLVYNWIYNGKSLKKPSV